MKEHIAYAMRNEEATQSWIYFNSVDKLLDWTHLAIQGIIFAGLALAILHAVRCYKQTQSPSALLTLLACLLYGLLIDILSYYTVENFWHGEFSVMFLFNKLPLYIVCFYPAFMYHAVMTIRRYEFPILKEAICTGFLGGLMYLIFDNFGPMVGWWIWDTSDATTWPYVSSVPLTSYTWFFLFTAAFTFINRIISWTWIEKQAGALKITVAHLLQPVLTVLVGSLMFIPYNFFSKSAPPYDMLPWEANIEMAAMVHVILFSLAAWYFLMEWRAPKKERDSLLMVFPFLYLLGHTYMYIAKFHLFFTVNADGLTQGLAVGNLIAVILSLVLSSAIILLSHPTPKSS